MNRDKPICPTNFATNADSTRGGEKVLQVCSVDGDQLVGNEAVPGSHAAHGHCKEADN